jgi:hypothetical protein
MTILSAVPAQAVFGLSACEKIKDQINKEEQVGLIYFREYDKLRDSYLSRSTLLNNEYIVLLNSVKNVYESDKIVYARVEKNQKCFSAKDIARARTEMKSIESELKTIKDLNRNAQNSAAKKWLSSIMTADIMRQTKDWARTSYPHFYDFISGKKLD